MRTTTFTIGAFALCFTLGIAESQAQQAVMVDIARCMALNNSAEKYACYDELEASARAAQPSIAAPAPEAATASTQPGVRTFSAGSSVRSEPPAPPVPPSPPAAPSANDQSVATFGTSTPSSARVLTSTDGQQELHDRITDLREREPGRYVITLASGQIWYQSNSQRFRLRKGMDVRIYPSPLGGSYRMARNDGQETGFVQVERLK